MCLSIIVDSPDRLLSEGEAYGFQWTVVHNTMGYRCGYIRLPENHPWHGCDYDIIDASVHGGLTFSEPDESCDAPGPDSGWWIGFDCAHAGDRPDPALLLLGRGLTVDDVLRSSAVGCGIYEWGAEGGYIRLNEAQSYGEIRTQEYVEEQCKQLCMQALAVEMDSRHFTP
jgi:hypothetical protein